MFLSKQTYSQNKLVFFYELDWKVPAEVLTNLDFKDPDQNLPRTSNQQKRLFWSTYFETIFCWNPNVVTFTCHSVQFSVFYWILKKRAAPSWIRIWSRTWQKSAVVMDSPDNFFWSVSYGFILVTSNILYSLITDYISAKPLGLQSLFDTILKDHIRVARLTGQSYDIYRTMPLEKYGP